MFEKNHKEQATLSSSASTPWVVTIVCLGVAAAAFRSDWLHNRMWFPGSIVPMLDNLGLILFILCIVAACGLVTQIFMKYLSRFIR
jgi:hypothetical protein